MEKYEIRLQNKQTNNQTITFEDLNFRMLFDKICSLTISKTKLISKICLI